MAYVPWWQEAAEINNQNEREEFIKGVFGFRPKEKRPNVAALIAGTSAAYVAGALYVASKAKKKK
jgi:hypothetical protein